MLIWENNVLFHNLNDPPSLQYTCDFLNRQISKGFRGNWTKSDLEKDGPLHMKMLVQGLIMRQGGLSKHVHDSLEDQKQRV